MLVDIGLIVGFYVLSENVRDPGTDQNGDRGGFCGVYCL